MKTKQKAERRKQKSAGAAGAQAARLPFDAARGEARSTIFLSPISAFCFSPE